MSSTTPSVNQSSKVVRAGAGAGKTTNLISEVYSYYKNFKESHGREPRVVLTTFTRKATQELRERLMLTAQKKQDYEFLNFVLSKNNLMISTIHGVLQLFLRQFAQVIDLDPGFQLINDDQLRRQSKIILRELLSTKIQSQFLLDELSVQELCTLLLRYHELELEHHNISSYTREDFEMARASLLADISEKAFDLSQKILSEAEKPDWQEYAGILKVISQDLKSAQSGDKISEVISYLEGVSKPRYAKKNPPVSEETNDALTAFKKEFDKKLNPVLFDEKQWDLFLSFYKHFEDIAKDFSAKLLEWKKKQGQITISDLELFSLSILKSAPHQVVFFSETFDYWLIDEFQDTSPLQIELLKKLSAGRPRYVVGDPQQSIYFFRGARRQVFDDMQTEITEIGGRFEVLKTNYRSDKALMSFVNFFFKIYSADFSAMELGPKEDSKKDIAKICLAKDESEQEAAILKHIKELMIKEVELSEVCVIARNNYDLKKIAGILEKEKIPHILHSASGFQGRREVLDGLAILKFLINPHDNFNLIEVLRSPWFRVKDEDIIFVTDQKPESFWQKFLEFKSEERYLAIDRLKKYSSLAFEQGITYVFEKIISESGIIDHSYRLDRSGRRESNLWKLLVQLKTEDHRAEFNYADFIKNRLQTLRLEEGNEDSDAMSSLEPNCIQLMTVHMSKGLEFDHVIMPFIDKSPKTTNYLKFSTDQHKWAIALKLDEDQNIVPLPAKHVLQTMQSEELSESDRLLYVAMTRAKKTLLLSTSGAYKTKDSWFEKIGIPMTEGLHQEKDFHYIVELGPWESPAYKKTREHKDIVVKPLMDLEALKKNSSEAVTKSIESKYQSKNLLKTMHKAQYGIQAHQIFESLKYGKQISKDAALVKAQKFLENLKEIPMKEILKKGFAEWGYVLTDEKTSKTMAGQIDLWALIDSKLWVIDYKTGRSSNKEQAFEQLAQYAEALKNYVNYKECELVAVYPLEEMIFKKKY